MEANEQRQLENFLIVNGLAGLRSPDLLQQLANLVSDWPFDRHRFLEDLLNECDVDKRYEMYHAVVPKLRFQALSLHDYEARIQSRASGLVSHRKMRVEGQVPRPIEIDGEKFEAVPRLLATDAVATLKCRCGRVSRYLADTPAGAMIKARKDGWVRDKATNHEMCPKCIAPCVA